MGAVKPKEIQRSDILRLEAVLNNLWGELNSCNIPQETRLDMEKKLNACEDQLKSVLSGQEAYKNLETSLNECDQGLALAAVQQAESELSKSEHTSSNFWALENVRKELKEGTITPVKARHEVKNIMRHPI